MKKEKEIEEEQWDKKKVLITAFFLVVGLLVLLEVKGRLIDKNKAVLGDAIQNKPIQVTKPDIKTPNFNVSSAVGSKIDEIKKSVGTLDASEVASSSPQIQKVLQDIQGIKDLPSNQAREMCLKVCSGI